MTNMEELREKYEGMGENPDTYLEGLYHSKPLTYWEYIQVDTLLSLQKTRTSFADEKIFVIYHQVTELIQELVLHELRQLTGPDRISEALLQEKMKRLNRYTRLLINSFDVMRDGMDYDDYNVFRKALAPASGFQSVNFRYIELRCTTLENLVNQQGRARLPKNPSFEDYFANLYWRDAGLNHSTGEMTLTLKMFCNKYEAELRHLAKNMQGHTLSEQVDTLLPSLSDAAREALRSFDHLYNVEWPVVHLRTAAHYLDAKGETQAGTGGSTWKKYLHPKYQQRKFFPQLWTAEEIANWGCGFPI